MTSHGCLDQDEYAYVNDLYDRHVCEGVADAGIRNKYSKLH